MVQGNDETIKKFLAKKLKESKQQLDEIKLKYEHSEEQLHNHSNNDRLLMELNTLKDEK
jgi:Tfp pilus assembly protein PilO